MLKQIFALLLGAGAVVPTDGSKASAPGSVALCSSARQEEASGSNRRWGRLGNGLTYVIQKGSKDDKGIELRLVVRAGNLQEDADQIGVAHLIEHLGFTGTARFPGTGIRDFAARAGVVGGVGLQGNTGAKVTVYRLSLPETSRDQLGTAVQILKDWASAITITDAVVETQRGPIIDESGSDINDGLGFDYLVERDLAGGTAYERGIRHDDAVRSVSPARVRDYYRNWYTPDRISVVIVGAHNLSHVECLLRSELNDIPPPRVSVTDQRVKPIPKLGGQNSVRAFARPFSRVPVLRVAGYVAGPASVESVSLREIYIRRIVFELFRMRAKAYDEPGRKLLPSLLGFESRDPDLAVDGVKADITLQRVDQAPEAARLATQFFRSIDVRGFTAAEFARAKDIVSGEVFETRDSNFVIANRQADLFISSDRPAAAEDRKSRLALVQKLSLSEINRYAQARIDLRKNYHVVLAGTDAQAMQTAGIDAAVEEALAGPLLSREAVGSIPDLDHILSKRPPTHVSATETLSPNIRLIRMADSADVMLVRTPVRDFQSSVRFLMVGNVGPAALKQLDALQVLAASGSVKIYPKQFDKARVDALFEDRKLSSSFKLDRTRWTLSSSARGDSGALLQYLGWLVTNPGEQGATISTAQSGRVLSRVAGPFARQAFKWGAPLPLRGELDQLLKAVGILRPRLVVVAGDFDLDETAKRLGNPLPKAKASTAAQIALDAPTLPLVEPDFVEFAQVSQDSVAFTRRIISGVSPPSPRTRTIAAVIGQILNGKMRRELRDRLGIAYFFGANATVFPGGGGDGKDVIDLATNIEIKGQSLPAAESALDGIIADIKAGAFSDDEVDQARSVLLSDENVDPYDLINDAVDAYLDASGPVSLTDSKGLLRSIPAAEVKRAAREIFGNATPSRRVEGR